MSNISMLHFIRPHISQKNLSFRLIFAILKLCIQSNYGIWSQYVHVFETMMLTTISGSTRRPRPSWWRAIGAREKYKSEAARGLENTKMLL